MDGIVHKNVYTTELVFGSRNQLLAVFFLCYIGSYKGRFAASGRNLACRATYLRFRASRQKNTRTLFGEKVSYSAANATPRTGDEDNSILKKHRPETIPALCLDCQSRRRSSVAKEEGQISTCPALLQRLRRVF